jgi:hypothetical protein
MTLRRRIALIIAVTLATLGTAVVVGAVTATADNGAIIVEN